MTKAKKSKSEGRVVWLARDKVPNRSTYVMFRLNVRPYLDADSGRWMTRGGVGVLGYQTPRRAHRHELPPECRLKPGGGPIKVRIPKWELVEKGTK